MGGNNAFEDGVALLRPDDTCEHGHGMIALLSGSNKKGCSCPVSTASYLGLGGGEGGLGGLGEGL
jgi:hypothetical protein